MANDGKKVDTDTFDYSKFIEQNRGKIITTMIDHFPNQFRLYTAKTKEFRSKILEEELRSMSPEKFFKLYGLIMAETRVATGEHEATIVKHEIAKKQ